MDKHSYLSNADGAVIEDYYQRYINNPDSVSEGWRKFFEGFEFARKNYDTDVPEGFQKEFKVINLIDGYRTRGHLFTKTNPVRARRTYRPTLDIENYGLEKADLETVFQAGNEIGIGPSKLKDIIDHLEQTYCDSIGIEYMYIRKPEEVAWIREKLELKNRPKYSEKEKKHILHKLNQAVVFEKFLHTKFVGQKRFSLEGNEALIPALDAVIEKGADIGIKEFIIGMAHRGRLNVLANIFNKTYEKIFSEFEGKEYEDNLFDGDVKYHLGYSCDVKTDSGHDVHMTLAPNPSHLETVGPVVEGITRSKLDTYLKDEKKVVPIIIHGDAAIAGQGVVYEVVQMAQLDGYRVGGTLHIVVNNQIGFTTNYIDGRSSTYCTDVAKVTLSPVLHVNGDDVEAVIQAIQFAIEYRQTFHKDVFIDILGYRKYGHNEGDEPKFTQPLLYKAIGKHKNPRDLYLDKLISEGIISKEKASEQESVFNQLLQERLDDAKQIERATVSHFLNRTWQGIEVSDEDSFLTSPDTSYDKKKLIALADKINSLPKDKKFINKLARLFEARKQMIKDDNLDWAMGELLAYATLLADKHPIRFSGQDVERGTFSHRHAVVKVEDSEEEYTPLNNISKDQAPLYIYNSLLSEYGVLGFEYGYAMASPNALTIWEAQFGDFNNGAQIIIDQFLSAAEEKWKTQNGLVMLLPHGYEGQGAEHSSGRMERFLQLCAEDNMQVANCSTPANFFHILRRQLKWNFRKPLVVFTPKSLLRHPKCVSTVDELAKGKFQEIIDDTTAKAKDVDTLVFCTGKFYYDLLAKKEDINAENIALVRLEQLYPLPFNQIEEIVKKYNKTKKIIWAQEEPENMGAWSHMMRHLSHLNLEVISLAESGAPATGSAKAHVVRHTAIIDKLFENTLVS
ncbi:MAG: 2-oxoglutarate dehydrogenase E1 component [Vicingaceae bacterium]|nr:2-oxoglutarate dehydrogenase E1 component [Flavobacteriales bacterium]MBQ20301.1 2-oxoglutarate dehydrogenase E1 component [Flavobacteriales bacterium]MDF1674490.1 2-oxoglutarate dehydrogenase E1 component [Vicingaceae bacterium]|tara:strand:+ start:189914 stop:192625 length:2712 start_codon:yes stop_codon:yes gene_type:complete